MYKPKEQIMDWRSKVAYPQRFSTEVCDFLDKHHQKGKLSRVGTYHIRQTIGALVPFVLCPLKIKKTINLLPLDRTKFKTAEHFKSALVNMYIYGYMPDVPRALVERAQYWHEFRKRWQLDHPESMAKVKAKQAEKQIAYEKVKEDFLIYQLHEVQTMETANPPCDIQPV